MQDSAMPIGMAEVKRQKMLVQLTAWMMNEVSGLSDEQIQEMLRSEHGD